MTDSCEPPSPRAILASRSPRRKELLQLLVPAECIEVVPPRDSNEAGFSGLHELPQIEARLAEVARAKAYDVTDQIRATSGATPADCPLVIAADTVIVVSDSAGRSHVLGQPPDDDTWPEIVRSWFRDYYAGQTHLALTGLCVQTETQKIEQIVRTEVTFTSDVDRHLDWYLSTGEPRGKAGGYALQGAGSIFVTNIAGSLSNVVGLPLEVLWEILKSLGILTNPSERRG
jgi:septum formation protein